MNEEDQNLLIIDHLNHKEKPDKEAEEEEEGNCMK